MSVLEAPIVKKIAKELKKQGWWGFKTHGGADQIRGLPDLVGCYHGYFLAMEVKKPGKDATPLQAFTIQQIRLAGGIAGVVHSVEEALDLLGTVPEPPAEALEERDD